jgi:hypothetical protein
MIVPFAAGGPTDTVGRLIAEKMSADLGQQIIVENVGGAGGTLSGAEVVVRAARIATVVVADNPSSDATRAKRAWLAGLDGTRLAFRSAARPFMRVLGWRAWTMRGPADDVATAAAEDAAEDVGSVDAEGNVALRTLVRRRPTTRHQK